MPLLTMSQGLGIPMRFCIMVDPRPNHLVRLSDYPFIGGFCAFVVNEPLFYWYNGAWHAGTLDGFMEFSYNFLTLLVRTPKTPETVSAILQEIGPRMYVIPADDAVFPFEDERSHTVRGFTAISRAVRRCHWLTGRVYEDGTREEPDGNESEADGPAP